MNQINGIRMENVQQLKVFVAVADTLSFTRAGERLFLTQSAISHQIAKLEREIGCSLLERRGRTVALTAAGRKLTTEARRVFAQIESAIESTRHAADMSRGRIRIGASNTACQYIIPEALREFRESFPDYSLSITPGDSPVSMEHLTTDVVDLALMMRPDRNRKLQIHPLFEDELKLIVSPLHPGARAGRIDRRQLTGQRMILYSRGSATFRLVERYFARLQVSLQDWIELGDIGAIKELVKIGLGISVMAPWVVADECERGSLVALPLPGARLRRRWCIAALAGRKLSLAEQTFIGLCQAVAEKMS
jgi:DNA-binding transcriptional LysR family regulator